MISPLQAKKNYVQAVKRARVIQAKVIDYAYNNLVLCKQDLQRLGIEPNYSLIVTELKGL